MVNSTIHELLKFEKCQNPGNQDLKQWFEDHLCNKLAICSYNKRFVIMKSIDFDENEDTTFERKNGQTSEQISYNME